VRRVGVILRPVGKLSGTIFRDRYGDRAIPSKWKRVVYLAFSRGEVAERLKAAVC
jgi:hypothetical protein